MFPTLATASLIWINCTRRTTWHKSLLLISSSHLTDEVTSTNYVLCPCQCTGALSCWVSVLTVSGTTVSSARLLWTWEGHLNGLIEQRHAGSRRLQLIWTKKDAHDWLPLIKTAIQSLMFFLKWPNIIWMTEIVMWGVQWNKSQFTCIVEEVAL